MLFLLLIPNIFVVARQPSNFFMSHGSPEIFFVRPIAATIMEIALALLLWLVAMLIRRRFAVAK